MINRLVEQQCSVSVLSPPLKNSCGVDTSPIDQSRSSFHLAAICFTLLCHLIGKFQTACVVNM